MEIIWHVSWSLRDDPWMESFGERDPGKRCDMNSITQLCTITGLRGRVIDKWLVGRALRVSQGDYWKLLSSMSILQKARSLQGDPGQGEASRVTAHRYALQRPYLQHMHQGKPLRGGHLQSHCQEQRLWCHDLTPPSNHRSDATELACFQHPADLLNLLHPVTRFSLVCLASVLYRHKILSLCS